MRSFLIENQSRTTELCSNPYRNKKQQSLLWKAFSLKGKRSAPDDIDIEQKDIHSFSMVLRA